METNLIIKLILEIDKLSLNEKDYNKILEEVIKNNKLNISVKNLKAEIEFYIQNISTQELTSLAIKCDNLMLDIILKEIKEYGTGNDIIEIAKESSTERQIKLLEIMNEIGTEMDFYDYIREIDNIPLLDLLDILDRKYSEKLYVFAIIKYILFNNIFDIYPYLDLLFENTLFYENFSICQKYNCIEVMAEDIIKKLWDFLSEGCKSDEILIEKATMIYYIILEYFYSIPSINRNNRILIQ